MIVHRRPVRFEEVDAAGIVFFGLHLSYAHEAMERLFDGFVDGGYVALITRRRVGFPAVKVDISYLAPLRYGDAIDIEARTVRLGNRSATLGYRLVRAHDRVLAAEIAHTVVVSNLDTLASCPMPADVRAALEGHLEPAR